VFNIDSNEFISVHAVDHSNGDRMIEMPPVTFTSIMQAAAQRIVTPQVHPHSAKISEPTAPEGPGMKQGFSHGYSPSSPLNTQGSSGSSNSSSNSYQKMQTPRNSYMQTPRHSVLDIPIGEQQEVILSEHRDLSVEQLDQLIRATISSAEEDVAVLAEQEALAHDMERIAKYGTMFSTLASGSLLWDDRIKVFAEFCNERLFSYRYVLVGHSIGCVGPC
jgi:hypothetical protein